MHLYTSFLTDVNHVLVGRIGERNVVGGAKDKRCKLHFSFLQEWEIEWKPMDALIAETKRALFCVEVNAIREMQISFFPVAPVFSMIIA